MKDLPAGPQPKFIRSRGLRFPYDPQVIPRRRQKLLREDRYEEKESDAVLKVLRPGDTVIELGAGMGYMSTLIATKLAVRNIHAFEANPALIPYIASVHAANGVENVTVHNALLGPAAGQAKFYVRGDFVSSSLSDNLGDAHGGVVAVHDIEVRDINAVFAAIRPSFLICDIEGAEADLLPVAADLSGLRGAVIELHPQWIGPAGVRAVFDAMHRAGLTYYPKTSTAKVVTFLKDW